MKPQIVYMVAFLAALSSGLAMAQDFSADAVTQDASGHIFRGKIYRNGNMIRAESTAPGPAAQRTTIVIVDTVKQTSYTMVSNEKVMLVAHGLGALDKVGIALPVNENPCTSVRGNPASAAASCKKLGEETVNGRHATKWEVNETINGQKGTQTVWVDASLHSAVKIQFRAFTQELLDIKEGPQSASLFVVPADYRQMDVGGR